MENMIYKPGDLISFNGQYQETKRVVFSGLSKAPNPIFHNVNHEIKVLVANPRSKFKVTEANYPYYMCEKIWELGDEEIPICPQPVPIHVNEVIPYLKEWEGTVINKVEDL
jgi:hypothetical protein